MALFSLEPKLMEYEFRKALQHRVDTQFRFVINYLLKHEIASVYEYGVYITPVPQQADGTAPESRSWKPVAKDGRNDLEKGCMSKTDTVINKFHAGCLECTKGRCRKMVAKMMKFDSLKKYIPFYDGQNIYTSKPLPFVEKKKVLITCSERNCCKKNFEVILEPVGKQGQYINLSLLRHLFTKCVLEVPEEIALLFCTAMYRHNPFFLHIQLDRSFLLLVENHIESSICNSNDFCKSNDPCKGDPETSEEYSNCTSGNGSDAAHSVNSSCCNEDISNVNEDVWSDYEQKADLFQRPVMTADVYVQDVSAIEYINEILCFDVREVSRLKIDEIMLLKHYVYNIKVEVTHLKYPRKYTVRDITELPATDVMLNVNGKDTSVAEYFAQKYEPLQYPYLPCMHMRSSTNMTFIPLEVCVVIPKRKKFSVF